MKLMVLNDGETYCNLSGCAVVEIEDEKCEELLDNGLLERYLKDRLHSPFNRVDPEVEDYVKILKRFSERNY